MVQSMSKTEGSTSAVHRRGRRDSWVNAEAEPLRIQKTIVIPQLQYSEEKIDLSSRIEHRHSSTTELAEVTVTMQTRQSKSKFNREQLR